MIRSSIDINRRPADVFAYIDQLDRHGEWQEAIVSARKDPQGPTRVGTHNIELRRVPGGPREFTTEIVEYDPPRRLVAQGLDGPIRPRVTVTVEPIDGGSRSRVTLELELAGVGIGKLLAMMARRQARVQVPKDQAVLKALLENGKA